MNDDVHLNTENIFMCNTKLDTKQSNTLLKNHTLKLQNLVKEL